VAEVHGSSGTLDILLYEHQTQIPHKNFHILVDPEDRFFILINAPQQEANNAAPQEPEDNVLIVFNALLHKVSSSPHRLLMAEPCQKFLNSVTRPYRAL
jgi:hypothetical protein